jgi:wyosine [tRNA(Phe)-imidazoG37] synthetase (radical SAM superfamily)|tara:strand:- start:53 stop:1225 length:1173 start_codon:yes stop_codon:yes gene_type:complete
MKNENKEFEWIPEKKYNPFNSDKLLAQVYRWRKIKRDSPIPQPALITVDPINLCNLKCIWCNADDILEKNSRKLSRDTLLRLADFFAEWKSHPDWEGGVESICIAGGGEPLLNKHTGEFIDRCIENGIEVGVVTHGGLIDRYIEPLSKCMWVGVSVDTGTRETFVKLKKRDDFDKIISNIQKLTDYAAANKTILSKPYQGYGVSYKYLLHEDNAAEIYQAAKIAKDIGCKNFHIRPVGNPWFKIKNASSEIKFIEETISTFNQQINLARDLEDDLFGVFGVTHKFNNKFDKSNKFRECYAVFMTAVFMPSQSDSNKFDLGLCCDRRGDDDLLLGKSLSTVEEVINLWGSKAHWNIHDKIRVEFCPRCTYQPHNQIFEHVIMHDNMTYKFI